MIISRLSALFRWRSLLASRIGAPYPDAGIDCNLDFIGSANGTPVNAQA
jgi:hypothetical protein